MTVDVGGVESAVGGGEPEAVGQGRRHELDGVGAGDEIVEEILAGFVGGCGHELVIAVSPLICQTFTRIEEPASASSGLAARASRLIWEQAFLAFPVHPYCAPDTVSCVLLDGRDSLSFRNDVHLFAHQ